MRDYYVFQTVSTEESEDVGEGGTERRRRGSSETRL